MFQRRLSKPVILYLNEGQGGVRSAEYLKCAYQLTHEVVPVFRPAALTPLSSYRQAESVTIILNIHSRESFLPELTAQSQLKNSRFRLLYEVAEYSGRQLQMANQFYMIDGTLGTSCRLVPRIYQLSDIPRQQLADPGLFINVYCKASFPMQISRLEAKAIVRPIRVSKRIRQRRFILPEEFAPEYLHFFLEIAPFSQHAVYQEEREGCSSVYVRFDFPEQLAQFSFFKEGEWKCKVTGEERYREQIVQLLQKKKSNKKHIQQKIMNYAKAYKEEDKPLLYVSHNLEREPAVAAFLLQGLFKRETHLRQAQFSLCQAGQQCAGVKFQLCSEIEYPTHDRFQAKDTQLGRLLGTLAFRAHQRLRERKMFSRIWVCVVKDHALALQLLKLDFERKRILVLEAQSQAEVNRFVLEHLNSAIVVRNPSDLLQSELQGLKTLSFVGFSSKSNRLKSFSPTVDIGERGGQQVCKQIAGLLFDVPRTVEQVTSFKRFRFNSFKFQFITESDPKFEQLGLSITKVIEEREQHRSTPVDIIIIDQAVFAKLHYKYGPARYFIVLSEEPVEWFRVCAAMPHVLGATSAKLNAFKIAVSHLDLANNSAFRRKANRLIDHYQLKILVHTTDYWLRQQVRQCLGEEALFVESPYQAFLSERVLVVADSSTKAEVFGWHWVSWPRHFVLLFQKESVYHSLVQFIYCENVGIVSMSRSQVLVEAAHYVSQKKADQVAAMLKG